MNKRNDVEDYLVFFKRFFEKLQPGIKDEYVKNYNELQDLLLRMSEASTALIEDWDLVFLAHYALNATEINEIRAFQRNSETAEEIVTQSTFESLSQKQKIYVLVNYKELSYRDAYLLLGIEWKINDPSER